MLAWFSYGSEGCWRMEPAARLGQHRAMNRLRLRTDVPSGHDALRAGRSSQANHAYHLTFTTREREPLFRDFDAARAVAACLHEGALVPDGRMLAWVVMPDHVHCLLQLGERQPLPAAVSALKSGSARRVNRAAGRTGPMWSRAYHDHALRSGEDLREVARYIVANPLRAGLVDRIGDYPFWNAVWLHDSNPV